MILFVPVVPAQVQPMITDTTATAKTDAFADLLPAIDASLKHDILGAWYPRAVDAKGGFHQTYAADWKELPDDKRGIVYQSRLTWIASQAALHAKPGSEERKRWQGIALHGLDYLEKTLWDADNGGGFFFEVTPGGKPDTDRQGAKHAYGISFGIYAAAAVYEATQDKRALALAQKAFAYLEKYSHDAKNGGYVEFLSRDNKPNTPGVTGQNDPVGTPYGYKSMNTHIHLLEAMTALYAVAPTPEVKTRLAELLMIVRDKVAVEPGCLNLYLTADFRAVPGQDSFGHDVETAFLLHEAAHVLGDKNPRTAIVARSLVDHALQYGWDEKNGGFYDEGTAFGAATETKKVWWTQGEGLNALLLMHELYGKETPRYAEAFRKEWVFIARYQIDAVNTGWRGTVAADGTPDPLAVKSDFWTDPYHQGRALFTVLDTLRK